jgi:hypothetical protein
VICTFTLTTAEEIKNEICNLKTGKASGPFQYTRILNAIFDKLLEKPIFDKLLERLMYEIINV